MTTETLWANMAPVASTGTHVHAHDVTSCAACATAAARWTAVHAEWWATRQGPRPSLSPFCS